MTTPVNRRVPLQWFSLQRMALMLDFDVSSVRAWWRAGRFGPPPGEPEADFFFVIGKGRGADVRISVRGYEFFLRSQQPAKPNDIVVLGRTPGEARRALDAVVNGS